VSVPAQSIFERIVTGEDVEQWCLETLKLWSGTYISEVERQHGIAAGTLQRMRAWLTGPSFDKWPEDQLPAVILQSVGTAERPLRDGEGRYRARWLMQLDCVCSARTQALTHSQSMLYAAAHRALLLQRPSLEGRAAGISWVGDDYTQLPYDDIRTIAAAQGTFEVEVEDVVTTLAGPTTPDRPLTPDTEPWPDRPTVQTVDEQVVKLPLEGG
jgi:hypothetical protein